MARRHLLPARNAPSLADYQPASGTWAASTAGESKLTGTDSLGAVTKERTSHIHHTNKKKKHLCAGGCTFWKRNSTDFYTSNSLGATAADVKKVVGFCRSWGNFVKSHLKGWSWGLYIWNCEIRKKRIRLQDHCLKLEASPNQTDSCQVALWVKYCRHSI